MRVRGSLQNDHFFRQDAKRVLHCMGSRSYWWEKINKMQAAKREAAKLQGDKTAPFCRKMSGLEVAG